jgi:hypothetical protein
MGAGAAAGAAPDSCIGHPGWRHESVYTFPCTLRERRTGGAAPEPEDPCGAGGVRTFGESAQNQPILQNFLVVEKTRICLYAIKDRSKRTFY